MSVVVYKIVNTLNGKAYIGQTNSISRRIWSHLNRLNKNRHVNRHLQASFNKYGKETFVFVVLATLPDRRSANEAETSLIERYNLTNSENGYNACFGGGGISGFSHSEEARTKIGEASRRRGGGRLGADKLRGKPRPAHVIEAIRAAHTGSKRSAAQVNRMRLSKLGKPIPKKWKAIQDNQGNVFESVNAAAAHYGVSAKSISNQLNGWSNKLKIGVRFNYLIKSGG